MDGFHLPRLASRLLFVGLGLTAPVLAAVPIPIQVDPVVQLQATGQCRGCDLRGADLRGAHLIGVDLREADLRGARLEDANLEGADLSGARLGGAILQRAVLSNAELVNTDLRQADLRDAVVINAYAPGVRTQRMHYAGADLTGSHLIYGGGPD